MTEERRSSDVKLQQVIDDVNQLKTDMKANTEITTQVRDILATFSTLASVAKWLGAISAAVAGVWAMIKGFKT